MEGKFFCRFLSNRVELLAFGFSLLSLIAGILLLVYLLPAPSQAPFSVPVIFSEQPDLAVRDFYTPEKDCRLSINEYKKSIDMSLNDWIDTDQEQLSALTVVFREKKMVDNSAKKIFYTVITEETGTSKIYYEDRGDTVFEARVFGENEECYTTVNY